MHTWTVPVTPTSVEHGYGSGQVDRAIICGTAITARHFLLTPGKRTPIVVFMNKVDMVDDEELLNWWKWNPRPAQLTNI